MSSRRPNHKKTKGLKKLKKQRLNITKKGRKSKGGTRKKYKGGGFTKCMNYTADGICIKFDKYTKSDFEAKIVDSKVIINKVSQELKNIGVLEGTEIIKITQKNVLTSLERTPVKNERDLRALLKAKPLNVVFKEKFEEIPLSFSTDSSLTPRTIDDIHNFSPDSSLTPRTNDDIHNFSPDSPFNSNVNNDAAEEEKNQDPLLISALDNMYSEYGSIESPPKNSPIISSTKNKKKYYACCNTGEPLGSGGFKNVYRVTSELSEAINPEINYDMTEEEAEKSVFIVPHPQLDMEWDREIIEVKSSSVEEFYNEMLLQTFIANIGIAPKVLHIKSTDPYTMFFAVTHKCDFSTIPSSPFTLIKDKLKKLFDTMAENGYIYTDIKKGNICYDNNEEKFIFVDFDNIFCYNYEKFNKEYKGMKERNKTILSDIMEFMFLLVEASLCKTGSTSPLCLNKKQIIERVKEIIKKYRHADTPMYDNKGGMCLLDINSPDSGLSPTHMLAHYLTGKRINGYLGNRTILTNKIRNILSISKI
tara:strand:+ start:9751 stop:11346 length:1596 start_codon:yes stop_codon:yes gene_type:complete